MYSIFTQSQRLSNTTGNRIEAIQIAREWIEAFTNIRNTNWILFAADYKNCWNTLNYNNDCIWNNDTTDIAHNGSYTIYKNSGDRWELSSETSGSPTDAGYRTRFQVYKDGNGFYTQWSGTSFAPLFMREIQIQYIEDTDGSWGINSDDEKLQITSKVSWIDSAKTTPHTIELQTILTNWKNKPN